MAQRQAFYPVIRDSQGEQTNPANATVMADTGALSNTSNLHTGGGGIWEVLVSVSATALAEFVVQRRNADNGANVGAVHVFYCPANSGRDLPLRFEIETGERIRVLMNAALTGDAVANIIAQRVA